MPISRVKHRGGLSASSSKLVTPPGFFSSKLVWLATTVAAFGMGAYVAHWYLTRKCVEARMRDRQEFVRRMELETSKSDGSSMHSSMSSVDSEMTASHLLLKTTPDSDTKGADTDDHLSDDGSHTHDSEKMAKKYFGMSEDDYIQGLGLIRHPEGGFFIETYRSGAKPMQSGGKTALPLGSGRLLQLGSPPSDYLTQSLSLSPTPIKQTTGVLQEAEDESNDGTDGEFETEPKITEEIEDVKTEETDAKSKKSVDFGSKSKSQLLYKELSCVMTMRVQSDWRQVYQSKVGKSKAIMKKSAKAKAKTHRALASCGSIFTGSTHQSGASTSSFLSLSSLLLESGSLPSEDSEDGGGVKPYDPTAAIGGGNGSVLRNPASVIYWLQSAAREPVCHLHASGSTVIDVFNNGYPAHVIIVDTDTWTLHKDAMLGPAIGKGHSLQLQVPGHWWKAIVTRKDWTLITEMCVPGFDFRDWSLIALSDVLKSGLNSADKRFILDSNLISPTVKPKRKSMIAGMVRSKEKGKVKEATAGTPVQD